MKRINNGPKLITILLIIVIAAAAAANLFWGFRSFVQSTSYNGSSASSTRLTPQEQQLKEARSEQNEQQRQEESRISWKPEETGTNDLSTVVVDSYDAVDVLEIVGAQLGIDASQEYYVTRETSNEDFVIYTLQQQYQGIDVYGYELKMKTDPYGNLLSVNGKHLDIPEYTEEIRYYSGDCEELVRRYLKQTYGYSDDDYRLDSMGERIVAYDEASPSRCFLFEVYDRNWECAYQRIFVDAMTGQIASDDSLIEDEDISVNLNGQAGSQNLTVWRSSDTLYELRSDEDNIRIAVANSSNITDHSDSTEITWNPLQSSPNQSGVDALANLEKCYVYYSDIFNRNGITNRGDQLYVVVDVNTMNRQNWANNAAMTGTTRMMFGANVGRTTSLAAVLDVVGHESFHGVTHAECSLLDGTYSYSRQRSVQCAIGEGLSDIFGELIEDYSNDGIFNGNCDWIHNSRSFISPTTSSNANDFIAGQTDCHDGIPVVAYPLYLLNTGTLIGTDKTIDTYTLGKLYYNTLGELTSQTDFKEFRRVIEDYVIRMNTGAVSSVLTDAQMEGVLDAMDVVGIERSYSYSLTPGATLEVYNAQNQLDTTYHITITKRYGSQIVSEDINSERAYLDLPKGVYDIELRDTETGMTYSFSIAMNDNSANQNTEDYKDLAKVFTQFESKKNNIALVLDTSGSMDGAAITQTRKAALNFVDTIFDMAPNVEISLIAYNDDVEVVLARSSSEAELKNRISSLSSGGGTDMYDGMQEGMLQLANAYEGKSVMVVMSDGLPNQGPDKNGSYPDAVIDLANQIKMQGITIFSLGFFHNSSGSELSDGIALMDAIASEVFHYNVQDGDQIDDIFNEIGKQIGGTKYVYIRVDCPVNVSVTSGGEVLSSDPANRHTSASFGSLTFEGEDENDNSKIFRLNADADYEVWIEGTGYGTMDVSVSYPNDDSIYDDVRRFNYIQVTPGTKASMATAQSDALQLDVDTDGDGTFDKTYRAGSNSAGTEGGDNRLLLFHIIGILAVTALMIVLLVRRIGSFKKTMVYCPGCGRIPPKGSRFCEFCGRPYLAPGKRYTKSMAAFFKKRSNWLPQLIAIVVLLVFTSVHGILFASSRQVLDRLEDGRYTAAQNIYAGSVAGKALTEKYTDLALEHYLSSIEEGVQNGTVRDNANTQELISLLGRMIG